MPTPTLPRPSEAAASGPPAASSAPVPSNPPRQGRSRRTLERIARAALDILAEEGREGLTVHAVVERAGASVGSFYARFDGKDALLEYLGERAWKEAADRWDEALGSQEWGPLDAEGLVEASVRLLADAVGSRSRYLAALGEGPGPGEGAYEAFLAHVLEGLAALFLERGRELAHREPEVGVPLGLRAALSVLADPPGAAAPGLPPERRLREAAALLRAYLLGASGGEPPPDGSVDFFDIWG